ncbi:rhodanese-like domain-containing protein [Thioalkalivibrio sp.]|uniref:rhodanese-like domain-containing protein n=1 Tax=Thioalkalivibrio sp. TaxID=2093813 RepID=UPI0039755AE8
MKMHKTLIAALVSAALTAPALADDHTLDNGGDRYDKDGDWDYVSEVSAAQAYLDMKTNEAVVIDVRTLREYAAGHPERAYNVPYPRIDGWKNGMLKQDPGVFYWEVFNIVHGKTDTPIYTLCRTGSRSVNAADILASPEDYGIDGPAFENVRNIWEGFVGQPKYAYAGGDIAEPHVKLDLNGNGVADQDTADVYDHTTDMNPDKDGWRNFQNLPWTTKVLPPHAYQSNWRQYACWQTDEGCPSPF